MLKQLNQTVSLPVAHPFFDTGTGSWEAVSGKMTQRSVKKGEILMHHGDAADRVWLVLSGWIKLTRQTPDGRETIVGLCAGGDFFGEAALFAHAHYPYYAEALSDAQLLTIPSFIAREVIEQHPASSEHIMALLNDRIGQAQLKLEQLNTMSASQRLGCFLLHLCRNTSHGVLTLHIPVEKHVLALFLGMKPETLSRSIQQLKSQKVNVKGDEVTVGDIALLRDFVCNSCSESGNCEA